MRITEALLLPSISLLLTRSIVKGQVVPFSSDDPAIIWGRPNADVVYFDEDTPTNVSTVVGQKARLHCKVNNVDKKAVSWIRQRDLTILTVGIFTYSTDDRIKVFHSEGSEDWILEIDPVTFRDAGIYECQVSTSPKIFLPVALSVDVQRASIRGAQEVFIQNGSTIKLVCAVNTHSDNVGPISWYHDGTKFDYDSSRGGVSVEIEKTPNRTTSKLFLTRAAKGDSGNYTCAPEFADPASVAVHVVNGEESAAVHTANSVRLQCNNFLLAVALLSLLLSRTRR